MGTDREIVTLADVPDESTHLFRVDDGEDEREAILVRDGEGVTCWLNYCQHLTHIKLDKGSGATMRDGELVCENHGAYFDTGSGLCTFGPCEGAVLTELEVEIREEAVYLTDEDYTYLGDGPLETDDDLASSSNVEF